MVEIPDAARQGDKLTDMQAHELFCVNSIVKCPQPWGTICFVLNIFLPGVGTMISSSFDEPCNGTALFFGIAQLCTFWFAVGWIWSIYQGYMIYMKSEGLQNDSK